MASKRADILLHPIRLRIVMSVAGEEVTTADIARRLPDVPQATLYRHVARLAEAGMLEISGERQARGAVERTYRVNTSVASVDADGAMEMSNDEHFKAFATFVGILIESYGRYLDTPGADPSVDGVSIRQARLWLSNDEFEDMITAVVDTLTPYVTLGEAPGRSPRTLSTILMPDSLPSAD